MPTDLEQERELLRAERDAEICGIGYLVDGVRVSPERVRVFYRDRAALAAPAAPIPMHAICGACGRDYGDHDLTRCPTGIESHFRAAAPQALPERDQSRSAERQGLFRKFDVRRIDGSDAHGGKHHGCRYFVLDMDHDGHAGAALAAYAAACESTHPDLARDLREKWGTAPQEQPSDEELEEFSSHYADEMGCIHDDQHVEFARALLSRYGASPQGGEDAESVAKIFHPAPCKGLNCGSTDGRTHSAECEAQHAAAIAGGTFIPSNLAIPQPAGWGARGMSDEP